MQRDGAALMLLGWSLAIALLGVVLLVRGSSHRAALAERGRMAQDDPMVGRLSAGLDRLVRRTPAGRRLARWLGSTGMGLRTGDFLLLCLGADLALTVVFALVLARGVAVVLAVVVVVIAARSWGERQRRQRREAFIAQLPDLARVLSNGASAGLSLAASIELAAREMPEPAAAEMRTVVEQMRVGQRLDAAFEALRERLPSREVSVLMSTLVIQHRAGGDTVQALSELSTTLEARKDLLREVRTLMSGAVFNSWAVAGLGASVLLLLNGIDSNILREMTSSLIGLMALIVSGTLWTVAFVLVRRTTRVET
jgi:tight adherence protein B